MFVVENVVLQMAFRERTATNILAARLQVLEENEPIEKLDGPNKNLSLTHSRTIKVRLEYGQVGLVADTDVVDPNGE